MVPPRTRSQFFRPLLDDYFYDEKHWFTKRNKYQYTYRIIRNIDFTVDVTRTMTKVQTRSIKEFAFPCTTVDRDDFFEIPDVELIYVSDSYNLSDALVNPPSE